MNYKKQKVIDSLKWKKHPKISAQRLGMSEDEYIKIKQEVLQERKNARKKANFFSKAADNSQLVESIDLDKGQGKISGTFDYEPKTAEEIISLLKIDTKKWKLSQYWNKQMGDHWRVSALVTKLKDPEENLFKNLLETWKPKKNKIPKIDPKKLKSLNPVCGVMSLQDIHFGKEGNETIDKDFEDTVKNLMSRAVPVNYIEKLYFVVGGDLINMDTFTGTTTSGTPLDNCMNATEAYVQAFDAMHWAINYLKAFCKELVVIYVPGNHDRLSSYHLVHALSKSIDCDEIVWDISYEERKVHVWHNNFNAFEHGDKPTKNTPLVYATEYPKEWGNTTNRTLFTGHFHTERKVEYMTTAETTGFIHKTLPSLGKTDYYHYSNKYVGNRRSGKLEIQHPTMGNICELTYQAL
jgi:UDP-2,3-diacylglucosamine pyrophosphatase LpxH|tara:strand:+ start:2489 stop:3712 length:1224 start_codon:yes stop_codon:yes gene_type:complete